MTAGARTTTSEGEPCREGVVADEMALGPITLEEIEALFGLFAGVVALGEGFPQLAPLTRDAFAECWLAHSTAVIAARVDGELAGAYYLKPNGPGRAAHIANAGYVVAPAHRRRGIARALVADSIERAPGLGFDAMQFNFVFASNPARPLYEELGFLQIGTIPMGTGDEDAVIYWRALPART